MAKSLKSKRKMSAALSRLRRIEQTLDPYKKPATPQGKRPKNEWIPGDFVISRKDETADQPHCLVLE
jgi:hypothetical protein